jgi:acetate---CoA ligase (ADP-forming)
VDATERLRRSLAPAAVAVVGASARPGALSGRFVTGLLRHGFPGRVVPVNPGYAEVAGLPCVPRLGAAGEVDLAVLAVPRRLVQPCLEECAEVGVAGAVVFASGYAETGADGRADEERLAETARASGVRVIGPNSPGFLNVTDRCCAIASGVAFRERFEPGPVAIVAQSGGVAGLLAERGQDRGVGLSRVVCPGNEADVTVGEVLGLLADDPATLVAAVYVEGIRDGHRLRAGLEALRASGKGCVVLKAGATEAAARATAAHTGALASTDAVVDAVLRRHGAIRVRGLDDLLETSAVLAGLGPAGSPAVGLVSTSGGAGVVAIEAAERAGLRLPALAEATRARLRDAMPEFASAANPVDMSGMFVERPDIFRQALGAVSADPGVDACVIVLTVQPPGLAEDLAGLVAEAAAGAPVPLVALWTAGAMSDPARDLLRQAGVHVAEDPDRCMRALAARAAAGVGLPEPLPQRPVALPDLGRARRAGATEVEALAVLAAAGLTVAETRHVPSPDALPDALAAVGGGDGRWAVKASVRDLAHKSAAGAVALDVGSGEAPEAHRRVVEAARAAGASPDGALVQAMAAPGVETIVGARRDPALGPVVLVGLGGTLAESLDDAVVRALPLGSGEAEAMIDDLRGRALLDGGPGVAPADRAALARAIEGMAALAEALGPDLEALEVNPLIVHADGATCVDALLLFSTAEAP